MDTRHEIITYFAQFLPVDQIDDNDDIFQRGFVSSMFAAQLVTFVEKHFRVTVSDDDLELDNFRSVAALTAFVDAKRTAEMAK